MEAVGLSRDDTIVVQMDGEHDDDDSTTVVGTNGGKTFMHLDLMVITISMIILIY